MTKVNFYKWGLGLMVLLNLGIISFFIISKPKPPRHQKKQRAFEQEAVNILQLDEEQRISFSKLVEKHNRQMEELSEKQLVILELQFDSLLNPNQNQFSDSLLSEVGELEKQKIQTTYQHFLEIKSILKPNQISNYQDFIDKATKILLTRDKKDREPPKDF